MLRFNLEPIETKEPEKQETPEDFVVPDAEGMRILLEFMFYANVSEKKLLKKVFARKLAAKKSDEK